ncbi:MAG: hypothetical protein DRO40_09350 [Thermoprotei archaeon]|nr:MAG: hypothetical protein DRO40_09350 [Thermoprotei archaeon]
MRTSKILPLVMLSILLFSLIIPIVTPAIAEAQDQEIVLKTHGWWQPPPVRRFNPLAPKSIVISGVIYERLAIWNKMSNTYEPWLAESWEIDQENNKVIIHLRQDAYWHDGEKFTAEDVWTTLMLYKLLGRPVWKYISDVVVVDDYTVEYHVKEWSYLLLHYILFRDGLIVAPYHIYGDFAERVASATTEDELDQITEDLFNFEPETIVGTGPFKFVSITEQELVTEKFDQHWAANNIHIDKIVFPYITSNEVGWLHYQSGDLDYDCFMMPPQVEEQIKALPHAEVIKVYDLAGFALVFNFDNQYLRDVRVRQAIAYAIDRSKVAYAAGGTAFEPVNYPTGILKLVEETWLSDIMQYLDKYEYNTDKAKQLLEEAGFTYSNGKWYTPDGQLFTLTFIVPAGYTDWVAAASEVTEELNSFGIAVELKTPETTSYWSEQWYLGGNYDLAFDFFGAWMTYPYNAFERIFIQVNNRPKTQVQGENFQLIYDLGEPFNEEINATELVEVLARSFDEAEQKEAAQKLAMAVNHYLPIYPLAEKKLMLYYNVEHFNWPDPETNYELWQNAAGGHLEALAIMIMKGLVTPNPSYWGITPTTSPTTSPATGVSTTTVTETVTAPDMVTTAVVGIVLLIIGVAIGFFIKKK